MKKMFLTLVAMLSMTTAFAEGENAASVNTLEAYELNVNMNKLSSALNLADDQKEAVADIHHTFASELMFAAQYNNDDRERCQVDALRAQRQADAYLSHTAQHNDQQSWSEQVRKLVVISSMISMGDVPGGRPSFFCRKFASLGFFCLFCSQKPINKKNEAF